MSERAIKWPVGTPSLFHSFTHFSQRPSQFLFAFDGLEEGLEIAFPEGFGSFALDNFEK